MPGSVIATHVGEGDTVSAGTPLMVLEAMKMEHTITAPRDGVVGKIFFNAGDQVKEGDLLLRLDDPNADDEA